MYAGRVMALLINRSRVYLRKDQTGIQTVNRLTGIRSLLYAVCCGRRQRNKQAVKGAKNYD